MANPCDPVRPLLDGLADGEVERASVEPHLSACSACRAELDAVLALKARLGRLRLPEIPSFAGASERRGARRRSGWAAAAVAAAAGLLVIALSLGAPPALL